MSISVSRRADEHQWAGGPDEPRSSSARIKHENVRLTQNPCACTNFILPRLRSAKACQKNMQECGSLTVYGARTCNYTRYLEIGRLKWLRYSTSTFQAPRYNRLGNGWLQGVEIPDAPDKAHKIKDARCLAQRATTAGGAP